MNVGSTFSGVGGLDLGLERAGMRVVWQAENDEWCRRVLRWHWPDVELYDDVRVVDAAAQNIDLLTGGFPCQDLSVAGKRAGLHGDRSGLFFEFARIANELQPRWIMLENVVGLLSSANGRDFGIVLATLAEIGYGVSWRVVDARFFGVPQRRRRVFIVGCFGDDGERAVRALGASGEGDLAAGECSWQEAAGGVGEGVEGVGGKWPAMIAPTLNDAFGDKQGLEDQHALNGAGLFVPAVVTDPVAKCLTTSQQRIDPSNETFVIAPAVSFAQNQRGELRESDVAVALTGGGGMPREGYPAVRIAGALDTQGGGPDDNAAQANHIIPAPSGIRRLTPTECERLMSWPDSWTNVDGDKTPDGRRYKACGNGVVSNVSEWIGRRIMALEGKAQRKIEKRRVRRDKMIPNSEVFTGFPPLIPNDDADRAENLKHDLEHKGWRDD